MQIKLSQDKFTEIDEEDFEKINEYNWHCRKTKNNYYAVANYNGTTIQLHRLIINCPKDLMVDHINKNGLDNRKINLRICSRSQNLMNSKKPDKKCTSTYKGVCFNSNKWRVEIRKDKKSYFIGYFASEKEAAIAYNKKAIELFGEFAQLNEVKDA